MSTSGATAGDPTAATETDVAYSLLMRPWTWLLICSPSGTFTAAADKELRLKLFVVEGPLTIGG